MSLVLDSSVTLAWVYPAEKTAAVEAVWARVEESGAWIPNLWRLEVANVLETGVRRGRGDRIFRDATLADLSRLDLRIDPETCERAWHETLELASRHGLTLYDAAYLELALRRRLPLATLDEELRRAAEAEQVEMLGV